MAFFWTTRVRNMFHIAPVYETSLPKPCCFSVATCFRSGHFLFNKMSHIIESKSGFGRKKRQGTNCGYSCVSLLKDFMWQEEGSKREILSAMTFSCVPIHLALIPTCDPMSNPQKNLTKAHPIIEVFEVCQVQFNALVLSVMKRITALGSSVIPDFTIVTAVQ